jgi:putative FmdB family regulatory protein|tara:strand:- start:1654 stop:2106 length:453 start_codon:yes stop_codon:yes gene_type:complete
MTFYDWICSDCEVIWEQEHPLGEAPKKTECPECGNLRERNWSSVTTFRMKGDCHTNRVRARDYHIKGMDKDTANEYYDAAIKRTEKGLRTGWQNYAKYTPKYENMVKQGKMRRRTEYEAKEAVEKSKKMTEAVYNDRNIDIKETLERKPQ